MENENRRQNECVHYDKVWQRIAPQLNPYPAVRAAGSESPAPPPEPPEETGCCLSIGSGADPDRLCRFIEEELEDRRRYLAFARCAPHPNARRILRELAAEEEGHARRLKGVYYMITGQCYRPDIAMGRIEIPGWCELLRRCYHAETCGGYRYQQAAQETRDVCLSHILAQISADEYRHAAQLLRLLEGNLLA